MNIYYYSLVEEAIAVVSISINNLGKY
uniref:Uncharacterized protein n=1 Tax=Rhizophora mucronata TaxID=61149 RepID=A0A2P2PK74_RHIMU